MDVPVKEGDVIDDVYRVERVIGAGGMAVVVAAIDERVPERVAIKVLFKKAAKISEILVRFEREQRVIQKLSSEHVARLLGSGVHKNAPYTVMEYLQGSDLSELVRVQGPLPIEQAAEYMLQACEGVAEAHGYHILHRDLKPSNLYLTRRSDGSPCVKVLDFGIAKIIDPQRAGKESTLTHTTAVMGSPFYMSPEQMISPREVGTGTDIWALGVTLFELLTAKLPFAAKDPDEVWARVLNDPPDSLCELRADCPAGLEAVVVRCLQRTPSKRFPNVGEFAAALAPFAPPHAREGVSRIIQLLEAPERASMYPLQSYPEIIVARNPEDPPEAPTVYVPQRKTRFGRGLTMALFGVGMLVVGFGGGLLARGYGQSKTAPAVSVASVALVTAQPSASLVRVELGPSLEDEMPTAVPIELDLDEEARRLAKEMSQRKQKEREQDKEQDAGVSEPVVEPVESAVPTASSSTPASSVSTVRPRASASASGVGTSVSTASATAVPPVSAPPAVPSSVSTARSVSSAPKRERVVVPPPSVSGGT